MQRSLLSICTLIILLATAASTSAQEPLPQYGVESIKSDFFRDKYLDNDLVHYLDNLDLYITYQAETTGQFNQPDQMIFAVEGSSYRWNNYYLDGFRVNSRFFAGSSLYKADLYGSDFSLDYIGSDLKFTQRHDVASSLEMSYNIGGLGGISQSTQNLIRLFHDTATDRILYPIEHRNKVAGAGDLRLNYSIDKDGKNYKQSLYATFGERNIVSFGNKWINSYYPEKYGSIQLNGELPTTMVGLFDSSYYLYNFTTRDNLYSEFYYGKAETVGHLGNSLSVYGKRNVGHTSLTSGLTLALNSTKHDDINFSRNVMDQDGEAFEPYSPDGHTFELSHSLTLNSKLNSWLNLSVDTYNSLIHFSPTTESFHNTIYAQGIFDEQTMLYQYNWRSESYSGGLLENKAMLSTERRLSPSLYFRADAGVTLDAILLNHNSVISPNIEAQAGVAFDPCDWFSMELTLARKAISYNIEDMRFLSKDYLNADINYINKVSGGSDTYFSSTGGALRSVANGIKQSSYLVADIPINFTFGRHRISFLQSVRKYNNLWTTRFDGDPSEYGYTQPNSDGVDIFFLNGGSAPKYVIDNMSGDIMGDSFLTSTPFYLSSNIQYSYTSPRFTFVTGWQSYMQSGLSTLGNGPLHNNLGVLSESSANPNTMVNVDNLDGEYMHVGRLDQERAYVIRMFASYRVNDNLSLSSTFKFKDGQPFSYFVTKTVTDADGNNQIAIIPATSRGINSTDNDFGTREDAFFNLDLRATYKAQIARKECEFQLGFYNLYDFGTELTEYVFDEGLEHTRRAMSLNIPRGLIFTAKINL